MIFIYIDICFLFISIPAFIQCKYIYDFPFNLKVYDAIFVKIVI